MKIKLENLGAIKDADFDLSKRLIVFCGPNNSGKTYAAFIIYALTKSSIQYLRSKSQNAFIQQLIKNQKANFKIQAKEIWKFRELELEKVKKSLDSIYGISEDIQKSLFDDFSIQVNQTEKEFEESILQMNFKNDI